MDYSTAVSRLETALHRPLPGVAAQAIVAPRPRREWPPEHNPARIRLAAGLLLVVPAPHRAHVVVTVRSETVRHAGQVSLPGGVVDPGETFEQAALREAREEIGLVPEGVRILGNLTPLDIPVSGFRLHPVMAILDRQPDLAPSDEEVARILLIDVDELQDPRHLKEIERERDGKRLTIPGFHVSGVEIWGATAMILAEFLVLLGWTPD